MREYLVLLSACLLAACEAIVTPDSERTCASDAQCDQLCLIPAGAQTGKCTRACDVSAACSDGYECLGTSRGRACAQRSGSGSPGQSCALDVDCGAGFCLDYVCTTLHRGEACRPGVDSCLDGFVCQPNDLGAICRTPCGGNSCPDECTSSAQCGGLSCLDSYSSVCAGSSSSSELRTECLRPGPLGYGKPCTKNYQCASGRCTFESYCPPPGAMGACT
jgi:hypothetical protein